MTATKNRPSKKNRILNLESLERRAMMIATQIVLDFTPDNHAGTFWDTFRNTRTANGQTPAFLDFNGDRRITLQDAEIAAASIKNTVSSFLAGPARGYDVRLGHGDVSVQSYLGNNWLAAGQRSTDQVLVMYFGGRNTGEIGRAPLAQDGYNVEGYGNTYTQAIANMLVNRPGANKDTFVWAVANTAAHELGHMLGLRHSRNAYSNDIMNPSQDFTPWNDGFSSVNQYTEGGGVQNSWAELQRSFAGQRTYFQGVNNGFAQLPLDAASRAAHDHEHEDHAPHASEDICDLDLDAVLAGFAITGEEIDTLPAESSADLLADLLASRGEDSSVHTVEPLVPHLKQPHASPAAPDLLTMLAVEMERTSGKSSKTATKSSTKELDELFTEIGLMQLN